MRSRAGVEAPADWDHLRTAETYLGYRRSGGFASPGSAAFDERRGYELPERLHLNRWALAGEWTVGADNVVLERAGGSIAYRFHARDAHLVLSRAALEPISFRVLVDGEPPGPSHGVDIDAEGHGVLRDGRMYQLVRQHDAVPADAGDHVPRARRRGVRVHVRVARRGGCAGSGCVPTRGTLPSRSLPGIRRRSGRAAGQGLHGREAQRRRAGLAASLEPNAAKAV
jgi:Thioredoxin like C-terminal domain